MKHPNIANFESISYRTRDGVEIQGRYWPNSSAEYCVVVVHGTGDHLGRFEWLIDQFLHQPFCVLGVDWRGNGRSGGTRGFIPSFPVLVDDLEVTLSMAHEMSGLPLIIFAQSFGGLLSLSHAIRKPKSFVRAMVISSPALRIAMEPPGWKLWIGRTLGRLIPRMNLPTGITVEQLTSDRAAQEAFRLDGLRHGKICARTFFSMLDEGTWVRGHASELKIPTLIMHGQSDTVTDSNASAAFADHCDHSECRLWPGLKHELHHETDKKTVLDFVIQWLDDTLKRTVRTQGQANESDHPAN